jgi:hypothetical protein
MLHRTAIRAYQLDSLRLPRELTHVGFNGALLDRSGRAASRIA